MKTSLAGIVIPLLLFSPGCEKQKDFVEIEMLNLMGEWDPVITVHGYMDDEDAAEDVIRGLHAVSAADGTMQRTYRVATK